MVHLERATDDLSRSNLGSSQTDAFDGTRKDINAALDRICEFTGASSYLFTLCKKIQYFQSCHGIASSGTKIVFWDLREPFIDGLYKPSASQSRLEALIESFDGVSCIFRYFLSAPEGSCT